MCIRLGIKIYYAESTETLVNDIQEVKPHTFTTVPRLLEKIYDKIYLKGLELKGIKKGIFFSSLRSAQRYEDFKTPGLLLKAKLALDNKLVFSKWREALGGEIKVIISGSAALQPRLVRVFTAAKIPIVEGYGLTETSPVITATKIGDIRPGTVGRLLDISELKIAEDGEILFRGPCLMNGYYKDKEKTDEAIDQDGWFHTGDMGELNDDILKVTGRKKELFKLSTGNYIAPQQVENIMKESPFIEQIMVVGENERFCSAIISPNFEHLKNWTKLHEITQESKTELVINEQVLNKYHEEIEELNFDVDTVMTIKKFIVVPDEWAPDTGELTPTLKLKRDFILKKYKKEIEAIYSVHSS
jgi:long-chain acyl-CoA synthetase